MPGYISVYDSATGSIGIQSSGNALIDQAEADKSLCRTDIDSMTAEIAELKEQIKEYNKELENCGNVDTKIRETYKNLEGAAKRVLEYTNAHGYNFDEYYDEAATRHLKTGLSLSSDIDNVLSRWEALCYAKLNRGGYSIPAINGQYYTCGRVTAALRYQTDGTKPGLELYAVFDGSFDYKSWMMIVELTCTRIPYDFEGRESYIELYGGYDEISFDTFLYSVAYPEDSADNIESYIEWESMVDNQNDIWDADEVKKHIEECEARIRDLEAEIAKKKEKLAKAYADAELYDSLFSSYQRNRASDYNPISGNDVSTIKNTLAAELMMLEGIHGQNPETGAGIGETRTYLRQYTNRIFGAPYQFLDSVDRRFSDINKYLGTEYMRNFILNSPILYIKPGLPHYTGGADAGIITEAMKNMYMDGASGNLSMGQSFLENLAATTIFGVGSKLQKRMYGLRETYNEYMNHVNYMCRSMAIFLDLTYDKGKVADKVYPNGIFVGEGTFSEFKIMRWETYRMLSSSKALNNWQYLSKILDNAGFAQVATALTGINPITILLNMLNTFNTGDTEVTANEAIQSKSNSVIDQWNQVADQFEGNRNGLAYQIQDKISTVQFMVEPSQFAENITNTTRKSIIEDTVDGLKTSIGNDLQFIMNSNTDAGILGNLFNFLGDTVGAAATSLGELTAKSLGGGFLQNFFSGAIQSIKGQKMIYPEIYENTTTTMTYSFKTTFSVPYGDVYNYYTGVLVPLAHILCLALPRMVTSNTTTSPYLVQAYIPGMCTCNLGIIQEMTITKNPSGTHVSVNGYPLTIEVEFIIKELYNALAISPTNDPASFLFNETLNDYMSNLAGLLPSVDTYTMQRKAMFEALGSYFNPTSETLLSDVVAPIVSKLENANPFIGR